MHINKMTSGFLLPHQESCPVSHGSRRPACKRFLLLSSAYQVHGTSVVFGYLLLLL